MGLRWCVFLLFLPVGISAQERDLYVAPDPERRLALVIGNDNYANPAWKLRNAVNDANDLAAELEGLGFTVTKVLDADQPAMERSINRFIGVLRPGDVAMFHYSGHGIQIEGENFLIPTDFNARDEVDGKYDSYSASRLQERLERAGPRLSIIVFDACRNNPFRTSRGGSQGLAAMNAGRGTFIAFATAQGQTADDNRDGRNGLFTKHLLEALREDGLDLDDVFDRVRQQVYEASGRHQLPWSSSSVIGEFYFRAKRRPLAAPTNGGDGNLHVELTYWNTIKDSRNPAAFDAYLKRYPSGRFADIARIKVDELRPPAAAKSAPAPAVNRLEVARVTPPNPLPAIVVEGTPPAGAVTTNPKDGSPYAWIPPGTFQMGCGPGDRDCEDDEKPRHGVRISQGFWIGQRPVTVALYERFAASTGREMPPGASFNPGWKEKDHPIVNVSWRDARAYCQWSDSRLPTEAEWEYAARAGNDAARYGNLDEIAWSRENSKGKGTRTAGEKRANAWGLHDMLGSVWEWCADWYGENYYRESLATDPGGPSTSRYRVLRGGSWNDYPNRVRLSERNWGDPGLRNSLNGFRCARDPFR